ncbi:hypothetical protein I317_06838 [Kwoniella heveanensis CBS 569]|nr:hypothetical protein I317_06838 [Kwoniella heveanensis CBS 569]
MPPPRSAGSKPKPRQVSSPSSSTSTSTSAEGAPSSTCSAATSVADTQIEALYNTAVQCFVRRDHLKTQATLSRLLDTLGRIRRGGRSRPRWYNLNQEATKESEATRQGSEDSSVPVFGGEREIHEEWMIKSLKLLISSTASLYDDPPSDSALLKSHLPEDLSQLIPSSVLNSTSTSPDRLLTYLHHRCRDAFYLDQAPDPVENGTRTDDVGDSPSALLLPPQILSTLILASLKLRPSSPALDYTHRVCEEWFANLPDSFILSISPQNQLNGHQTRKRGGDKSRHEAIQRRKVESAREGYIKVVELFVGEMLSREGEWEMARGFLDGEVVMSSKRKEALYRHLRSLQTNAAQRQSLADTAPSPSASLVLPVPSTDNVPSENSSDTTRPNHSARSRTNRRTESTSSPSSSSSERTARPGTGHIGLSASRPADLGENGGGKMGWDTKGKGKATSDGPAVREGDAPSIDSSRGYGRPQPIASRRTHLQSIMNLLPSSMSAFLGPYIEKSSLSYALAFPLPILFMITVLVRYRRRRLAAGLSGIAGGSVTSNVNDVRSRLRTIRAQERGWWEWFVYYVRWWIYKSLGVWKLGMTITYV